MYIAAKNRLETSLQKIMSVNGNGGMIYAVNRIEFVE